MRELTALSQIRERRQVEVAASDSFQGRAVAVVPRSGIGWEIRQRVLTDVDKVDSWAPAKCSREKVGDVVAVQHPVG